MDYFHERDFAAEIA